MIGITPENLANASLETIAEAIRPAGMYNQRSRVLKRVSEEVLERFDGTLDDVVKKPFPEARETLMSLPGVGPKTADVVLMFVAGSRIVPVDRHIFRIAERLGIVPEKASYDDVRGALEEASPPDRREDIHVFLIRFGRETCKARSPRCYDCFIEDLCSYPVKNAGPEKPTELLTTRQCPSMPPPYPPSLMSLDETEITAQRPPIKG